MVSKEMLKLSKKRFVIRDIFSSAKKKEEEIGAENVFDFSIGNPEIPVPQEVTAAIDYANHSLSMLTAHGYTNASGSEEVKQTIAAHLNKIHHTHYSSHSIFMTCGAAAAITISLKALVNPGEEVLILAPYYPEYSNFIKCAEGIPVIVQPNPDDFQIDFTNLRQSITPNTKAILINSPNNPSGVIYPPETIKKLAALLHDKSIEYNHSIYLISDEPYREIVYNNACVPFIPKYYDNTIICYSYSKCLSIPGHRIGYILMPELTSDAEQIHAVIPAAARILGFVQAPALSQFIVKYCVNITVDMGLYKQNRDYLYQNLKALGFECILPQGAFYLLVKSPETDVAHFVKTGTLYNLYYAPGDAFGCDQYVRLSFCMTFEQLERSMPQFSKLAHHYQLKEKKVS